jgi:hypothetical protein
MPKKIERSENFVTNLEKFNKSLNVLVNTSDVISKEMSESEIKEVIVPLTNRIVKVKAWIVFQMNKPEIEELNKEISDVMNSPEGIEKVKEFLKTVKE